MYVPTGNYYTDVTTDYIKIIPRILVLSKSNSMLIESDTNNHKTHKIVAKHYTIHFLFFFSFSFTWRLSNQID